MLDFLKIKFFEMVTIIFILIIVVLVKLLRMMHEGVGTIKIIIYELL